MKINPAHLKVERLVTVRDGAINLLVARYGICMPGYEGSVHGDPDGETLEVVTIYEPAETAFPVHTDAVYDYFKVNRPATKA